MFVVLLQFYSTHPTPVYGELSRCLRDRSHTVWIGQPSTDGSFVFVDDQKIVDRIPGPSRRFNRSLDSFRFMLRLRQHVQTFHPDVVQITPSPWSWLLACRTTGHTVFVNDIRTAGSGVGRGLRASLVDWSAWVSWRIGAAWLFDRTLFLNETGARWLLGERWADRSDVVPLGVGAHFLHAAGRPSEGRADRPVRFVYLGTISLERNLQHILIAARAVRPGPIGFRVTFLGPDDAAGSRAAIRRLVDRDGLQDIVDFMEPVSYQQVPAVLQRFDVALNYLPDTRVQRRQTLLKVLECRALGLPQITTRTAPNASVIRDCENGLLVEDSPQAYAAAMQRLVDDRGLLDRLTRQAGQSRVGITWAEVAEQYASIYTRLRDARQRPARAAMGSTGP